MVSYKKYFHKTIKDNYLVDADTIITETENNYTIISSDIQFAKTSKNPIDRRLDFCAYFLALVKTLDKKGESYETIRRISLEIVTNYVKPKNKLQEFAKTIPAKIINTWLAKRLLKPFAKRVRVNENKDGFIAHIITDKKETFGLGYGVDIIECGICKLFNKHNSAKYTPILCEVDKLTSNLAGLTLIRSGTIADGAEKCDFRFKRIEKKLNK